MTMTNAAAPVRTTMADPIWRHGAFVAMTSVLVACAPTITRGADVQSAPRTASAAPVGEPTTDVDPRTSGPIGITQLLNYANTHAPRLIVARQRARLGDAEVEGAERLLPYNPELGVTAGGRTTAGETRFEFAAQIEQRIQIAGQRGARIEAAKQGRAARGARLEVTKWELHVLIHALCYELLVRRKQVAAATKLQGFAGSVKQIVDKRVEAGEDAQLETVLAKAQLAKVGQLTIGATLAERETLLRIVKVTGWPAAIPLALKGELGTPARIPNGTSLFDAAVTSHPSKEWLELEVRAARARLERESLQGWPDPELSVRYGREAEPGAVAHVWTGTLRVPIPLWERNQAGRALARAQLAVAHSERAAFKTRLQSRINVAVARVNAAADTAELYGTDIQPALEGTLKKLKRGFALGELDLLKVVQIQERVVRAQRDALRAIADYYAALAALEAISGVELLGRKPGGARPGSG